MCFAYPHWEYKRDAVCVLYVIKYFIFPAIVIMSLSLCVGMVGGVIEGSMLVTSATSGALLGVFILATLCPVANGKGALCGMIAAHFITTWMAAGRLLYVDTSVALLPLSVDVSVTCFSFFNAELHEIYA